METVSTIVAAIAPVIVAPIFPMAPGFAANVSNAAVKSVDKKGSFDLFLKDVKNKNLSPRLKKIKKTILAKST